MDKDQMQLETSKGENSRDQQPIQEMEEEMPRGADDSRAMILENDSSESSDGETISEKVAEQTIQGIKEELKRKKKKQFYCLDSDSDLEEIDENPMKSEQFVIKEPKFERNNSEDEVEKENNEEKKKMTEILEEKKVEKMVEKEKKTQNLHVTSQKRDFDLIRLLRIHAAKKKAVCDELDSKGNILDPFAFQTPGSPESPSPEKLPFIPPPPRQYRRRRPKITEEDKRLLNKSSVSTKDSGNDSSPVKLTKLGKRRKELNFWTPEEDEMLIDTVERLGNQNWNKIAIFLPGRTMEQCQYRWSLKLFPRLRSYQESDKKGFSFLETYKYHEGKNSPPQGRWSEEEDQLLLSLVKKYGVQNWAQITKEIPGRSEEQIHKRWHDCLDPNIKKGEWTEEEDLMILVSCHLIGNNWSLMARHLITGRTSQGISIRWGKTLKRKGTSLENFPNHKKFLEKIQKKIIETPEMAQNLKDEYKDFKGNLVPEDILLKETGGGCQEGSDGKMKYKLKNPNKKEKEQWSLEDDQKLISFVEQHGTKSWKQVASGFERRNHLQCFFRWNYKVVPRIKRVQEEEKIGGSLSLSEAYKVYVENKNYAPSVWSKEEDEKLREIVKELGTASWAAVAMRFPERTAVQCRSRWRFSLDPNIKRGAFTPEEEIMIVEALNVFGAQWTIIANSLLPGRTGQAISSHWRHKLKERPFLTVTAKQMKKVREKIREVVEKDPELSFLLKKNKLKSGFSTKIETMDN